MKIIKTDVLILGSGPGGHTAAFRLADLGKKVTIVEKHNNIGGVCLNVGCIPSKTMLEIVKTMQKMHTMQKHGIINFDNFNFSLSKIVEYKNNIIQNLNSGLTLLSKKRNIDIIHGIASFISNKEVLIERNNKESIKVIFQNAIIAVGSRSKKLKFSSSSTSIMNSTDALSMNKIPKTILVVGSGIIGLEMSQIYSILGSKITIVEYLDKILPNLDRDIVNFYHKAIFNGYSLHVNSSILDIIDGNDKKLHVKLKIGSKYITKIFDSVLIAIGRLSNSDLIKIKNSGVKTDNNGFITVDTQLKTNINNIFAIGDVNGNPMLAHKAIAEAKIAAEVINGKDYYFNPKCIPSVAYTFPELACVGINEIVAKNNNIKYYVGKFPWNANGRAFASGMQKGITKLIFDSKTNNIIGGSIVGYNAGDLITEVSLAIEMNCKIEDISLTIHPHPTLSETIAGATEVAQKIATDIYNP